MYNTYLIKTNTKFEDFSNKNHEFIIIKRYPENNKIKLRDRYNNFIYLGYNNSGTINSVKTYMGNNPNFILSLIVLHEYALIIPEDLHIELANDKRIKLSGREDYFLSLHYKKVTESFIKYLETYENFYPRKFGSW